MSVLAESDVVNAGPDPGSSTKYEKCRSTFGGMVGYIILDSEMVEHAPPY